VRHLTYMFVLLGCLLLMVAFRSVLIPLTAAVMNLLAAAASFGLVVAVFQWGWGSNIIGAGSGPVESFLPIIMIAILFGLSMDYQVFLVSRMHEEWLNTGSNEEAIVRGQANTGQVITAAALIMAGGGALGLAALALSIRAGSSLVSLSSGWMLPWGSFSVALDPLSAVFLALVFVIPPLGSIYALEYWPAGTHPRSSRRLQNTTISEAPMSAAMAIHSAPPTTTPVKANTAPAQRDTKRR